MSRRSEMIVHGVQDNAVYAGSGYSHLQHRRCRAKVCQGRRSHGYLWIRMTVVTVFTIFTPIAVAEEPAGSKWRLVEGPLMTPWANDVSVDGPWSEHPRPLLKRDSWLCLNGLWDYCVQPRGEKPPARYQGQILVPFPIESALSGVMTPLGPNQTLWYHRTFNIPEAWKGKRVLLHFDGADWEAEVWLNGRPLGRHRGGYDSFDFDITDTLRTDGSQDLVVAVWDPTDTSWQMRGKQSLRPGGCSYTACSGLWQTVWLEAVPAAYIEDVHVHTQLAETKGLVNLTIDGRMPPDHSIRLRVQLFDDENGQNCLVSKGMRYEVPPAARRNLVDFYQAKSTWFSLDVDLTVDPARPWSCESPHLYGLLMELEDETTGAVDRVESYVGIREVSIGQDVQGNPILLLNGQPLTLVGALDQGYWPDGIYTAPTDEALVFDIKSAKRLGLNAVRKHVKVEPQRWYYWCDHLGLLVLQDFPSGNAGDPVMDRARSPEAASQWETEAREILRELGNHPSIIMWIVFNEGWGQFDTLRHVRWIKQSDPARLVNEASGFPWHGGGDVVDSHGGTPPRDAQRISITSEDGGWGALALGHSWNDSLAWAYRTYEPTSWRPIPGMQPPLPPLTEEAQDWLTRWVGRLFQSFWQQKGHDGRCGYFYTQLTDVETECNGLLTYDRAMFKVKPDSLRPRVVGLCPLAGEEVVATARQGGGVWRFTTENPPPEWMQSDFDDKSWASAISGFGCKGTPGAIVNTEWTTGQIWLRREFQLSDTIIGQRDRLRLRIHHDEDVVAYLNGVEAFREAGFLTDYDDVEIAPAALATLRAGRNILAVTCQQTEGGQYIDVGLILLPDTSPPE